MASVTEQTHGSGMNKAPLRRAAAALMAALALCFGLTCAQPGSQSAQAQSAPSVNSPPAAVVPVKTTQGILFSQLSSYGRVLVVQHGSRRCLKFGDELSNEQSCVDMTRPQHAVHEYVRFSAVGPLFVSQQPRVLMIGLGGGSIVRLLQQQLPGVQLDVIEINPVVVQAAREYFGVRESDQLRVHVGDGRALLERLSSQFDLIVLDAFGEDTIPFALATREFLISVRVHLKPGGAVLANVWNRNEGLYRAMLHTYADVFGGLFEFAGFTSGNSIIVARNGGEPLDCPTIQKRAQDRASQYGLTFDLQAPASQCQAVTAGELGDAPVLRDSNPDQFEQLGPL